MKQGTQINYFFIKIFSWTGLFPIPTLMEEKKPAVLQKNEFEFREELKLKDSFLEFSDLQDSDAREKNKLFSSWIFVYKY